MKLWSFFNPQTGVISPMRLTCNDEALANNTPAGLLPIAGHHDYLSARVDVTDLEAPVVVAWQPPQPDADHIWNADLPRPRWVLSAAAQARLAAEATAQRQIDAQEADTSRAVRELLLSPDVRALLKRPEDLANLDRLQAADEAISSVRPILAVKE